MALDSIELDRHIDYIVRCGAHAATMAACAAAALDHPHGLPADVPADLVTADYWYQVGRRTAAATDLCELLDCDFNSAMNIIAACVPYEDDPTDRHTPAVGTASTPAELLGRESA